MTRLTRTRLTLVMAFASCFAGWGPCSAAVEPGKEILFFYAPGCHECAEVKRSVLPRIREKFGRGVQILMKDISDIGNYKELLALQGAAGPSAQGQQAKVPALFFAGEFLFGREAIGKGWENLLSRRAAQEASGGDVDLMERFSRFTPLAVGFAGLIDGVNPCAFTVIVFFISFLSLQGYAKRELVVIGTAFIAAVFLTYILIGLGLFGFLYGIGGFWIARKAVTWAIAGLSIGLGCAAVFDIYRYARTSSTSDLILQLPASVKQRIQSVISARYRRNQGKRMIGSLAATAFVTGCLISVLEAVCTGQMYLPTISFIFKTSQLKARAFSFLALYNIMFVAPLAVVLGLAVSGTTSGQFSAFLKRHLVITKVLMAAVFFGLGIFLFWRG